MRYVGWTLLGLLVVGGLCALVLPTVGTARRPARRSQSLINQHNMGIAVDSWAKHDEGALPRGTLRDESGRALHGWPAQLLPMLDRKALHRAIDFTKPWDDAANRVALQVRIRDLQHPHAELTGNDGYALMHYAANSSRASFKTV